MRRVCSARGYCRAMDLAVAPEANAHTKGLVEVRLTDLATGRDRRLGVAYKSGARDPGVLVNVCPWCGRDLRPKEAKRAKPSDGSKTRTR